MSSEDMKIRNTQRMVTMNDELDVTQRDNEGNPSQYDNFETAQISKTQSAHDADTAESYPGTRAKA